MLYANQNDMIARFGEKELILLSDRTVPPARLLGEEVIARALADADGLIDSYLTKRYSLPLNPVPGVLIKVACDIARYYLHDNRPTETVKDNHEAAIKWLRDLSIGKADLNVEGVASSEASHLVSTYDGDERVFTSDSLKGL